MTLAYPEGCHSGNLTGTPVDYARCVVVALVLPAAESQPAPHPELHVRAVSTGPAALACSPPSLPNAPESASRAPSAP
eukprot:3203023-Prymnesium_polylepis.1